MKKTCKGCRANFGSHCELGYKTKKVKVELFMGLWHISEPLEPCPKPKTIMDVINAKDEIRRKISK